MDVGGSKTGAKSDINVTPLIDVVLVLLIIFMVLTPSMLKHLSANVPRKAPPNAPPPPPDQNPIVVELTKDREVAVNTDPVSWEALPDKVAERLKSDRQKVVFFKIDEEAMYGDAVKLFDMVRGAGAKVLGIVTREEQQ
jgi:biopolymer transport protein ExbD